MIRRCVNFFGHDIGRRCCIGLSPINWSGDSNRVALQQTASLPMFLAASAGVRAVAHLHVNDIEIGRHRYDKCVICLDELSHRARANCDW